MVPQLNSAIDVLPDGRFLTVFTLECTNCGYKTNGYEYPDYACHAWNMSRKLSVDALVNAVQCSTTEEGRMSTNYILEAIYGQYPFIVTESRQGKVLVQLTDGTFSTALHVHFSDAAKEWNDIAARVLVEGLINDIQTD
jgi:hypothetical protein